MIRTLIHEPQGALIEWAVARLPGAPDPRPCVAMGVAVGDKLAAVALFGDYRGHQIQIAVAAEPGVRWLDPGVLRPVRGSPGST